jgi:acetyl-CoA acetyltransferase
MTAPEPAPTVRRAAVLGGSRIPFARADGPYATASNQDMLGAALDGLVRRFSLSGTVIGEVAAGAVLKHSRDVNLTREVVLGSASDAPLGPLEHARINVHGSSLAVGHPFAATGARITATLAAPGPTHPPSRQRSRAWQGRSTAI